MAAPKPITNTPGAWVRNSSNNAWVRVNRNGKTFETRYDDTGTNRQSLVTGGSGLSPAELQARQLANQTQGTVKPYVGHIKEHNITGWSAADEQVAAQERRYNGINPLAERILQTPGNIAGGIIAPNLMAAAKGRPLTLRGAGTDLGFMLPGGKFIKGGVEAVRGLRAAEEATGAVKAVESATGALKLSSPKLESIQTVKSELADTRQAIEHQKALIRNEGGYGHDATLHALETKAQQLEDQAAGLGVRSLDFAAAEAREQRAIASAWQRANQTVEKQVAGEAKFQETAVASHNAEVDKLKAEWQQLQEKSTQLERDKMAHGGYGFEGDTEALVAEKQSLLERGRQLGVGRQGTGDSATLNFDKVTYRAPSALPQGTQTEITSLQSQWDTASRTISRNSAKALSGDQAAKTAIAEAKATQDQILTRAKQLHLQTPEVNGALKPNFADTAALRQQVGDLQSQWTSAARKISAIRGKGLLTAADKQVLEEQQAIQSQVLTKSRRLGIEISGQGAAAKPVFGASRALTEARAEATALDQTIKTSQTTLNGLKQKLAGVAANSPQAATLRTQIANLTTRLDNLSMRQRVLAIGGVTAAAVGGGGYYLSTMSGDSKNVKVGGVAPTGINGTVKGTYTNPDTGVKTIYMSDGRVYSQAAGGNAYLAGHYNPATLGAPVNQPGFSVFQKAGAIAGQASSPGSSSSTSEFGIDHTRNPADLRPTRHTTAEQLSQREVTYGGQTGVMRHEFLDGTVTFVKDGHVIGREVPAGVPDTTGTAPRRPIPQSQYDVIAGSGPGASLSQHVAAIASQSNPSTAASQVMQLSESSQVRPTGWRTHTITDIHADHRVNGTGVLTYGDGRSTVWRDGRIVGYVQEGSAGDVSRPPDTVRTVDKPIPGSGGTGVGTTTPVADHTPAVARTPASSVGETEAERRAKLAGLVAGNVVSHTTGANGNMLLHMANGNIVSVADDGKHFLAGRGTPATTPYVSRPPDVPGPAASGGGGNSSNDNPTQPITPTPVSNPTSENSATGHDANYTNVATFTPNYGLGSNGADQKPDAGVTSLVSDPNSLRGGV